MLALGGCATTTSKAGRIAPGYRPTADSDEGGLWRAMERNEQDLRRSRFLIRDPELTAYVQDIACRLAGDHCGDLRVYLLRTPFFNASMAPNGMMQVWSGMLLRLQNEAQLAAILGHEIGHYVQRHSLQRWRDLRTKADVSAFLGLGLALTGVPGLADLTQLVALASIFAFSREQEREADDIGLRLMSKAGYQPMEASRIWAQLIEEDEAGPERGFRNLLFATHPSSAERQETLQRTAAGYAGNATLRLDAEVYRARLRGVRSMLLQDELQRFEYERTLVVLRHLGAAGQDGELLFFEGEVYRLRDQDGDRRRAFTAYERAVTSGDAPPECWRSLGLLYRQDGDMPRAREAFQTYLDQAPAAPDASIIRSYLLAGG